MKKDLAEIICIMDRSGSMESIRTDAIGGFNAFLAEQKKEPGSVNLTLVLFDDQYDVILNTVPLLEVQALTEATYVPRGMTALLDAVGRTIDSTKVRIAETPEAERPERVIFSIITDGQENASKEYTRDQVFEKISSHREKEGWEFVFLAANQDAIEAGGAIGIPAADSHQGEATAEGMQRIFLRNSCEVSRKRREPRK